MGKTNEGSNVPSTKEKLQSELDRVKALQPNFKGHENAVSLLQLNIENATSLLESGSEDSMKEMLITLKRYK